MPHTLAQKILQAHTDEEVREAGQIVNCHLSGVLANDITGPLAIKSFRAMGAAKVFDKDRVFLVMDHFTPVSYTHLDVYKRQAGSWRASRAGCRSC